MTSSQLAHHTNWIDSRHETENSLAHVAAQCSLPGSRIIPRKDLEHKCHFRDLYSRNLHAKIVMLVAGFAMLISGSAAGQERSSGVTDTQASVQLLSAQLQDFPAAESKGVTAKRSATQVHLTVDQDLYKCQLPRLAAPLRSVAWEGALDFAVAVKPEQDVWILSWKKRPETTDTLVLTFGDKPKTLDEIEPVGTQSDASIYLPAHLATATGEKIRYEPQSYKNTVGYWVGAKDYATWTFSAPTSGAYNVAILQGCGSGQGGSDALITISSRKQDSPVAKLPFEVLETGHFQNFQWRTLGEIKIPAGEHKLTISPVKIANKALMDVRAVHLIRLPNAPKKR